MATATLREQFETEQAKAVETYRKAVAAAVETPPTFAKLRGILDAADKTVEQFEADLATLKQRIRAVADMKTAAGMDAEIKTAKKDFSEAHQRLIDLEDEYREKLKSAREEVGRLSVATRNKEQTKRDLHFESLKLLQKTADEDVDLEIARLSMTLDQAENDLNHVMTDFHDMDAQRLHHIEAHEKQYGDTVPAPEPSRRFQYLSGRREELEFTIKTSRERLEQLEASKLEPANQRWS